MSDAAPAVSTKPSPAPVQRASPVPRLPAPVPRRGNPKGASPAPRPAAPVTGRSRPSTCARCGGRNWGRKSGAVFACTRCGAGEDYRRHVTNRSESGSGARAIASPQLASPTAAVRGVSRESSGSSQGSSQWNWAPAQISSPSPQTPPPAPLPQGAAQVSTPSVAAPCDRPVAREPIRDNVPVVPPNAGPPANLERIAEDPTEEDDCPPARFIANCRLSDTDEKKIRLYAGKRVVIAPQQSSHCDHPVLRCTRRLTEEHILHLLRGKRLHWIGGDYRRLSTTMARLSRDVPGPARPEWWYQCPRDDDYLVTKLAEAGNPRNHCTCREWFCEHLSPNAVVVIQDLFWRLLPQDARRLLLNHEVWLVGREHPKQLPAPLLEREGRGEGELSECTAHDSCTLIHIVGDGTWHCANWGVRRLGLNALYSRAEGTDERVGSPVVVSWVRHHSYGDTVFGRLTLSAASASAAEDGTAVTTEFRNNLRKICLGKDRTPVLESTLFSHAQGLQKDEKMSYTPEQVLATVKGALVQDVPAEIRATMTNSLSVVPMLWLHARFRNYWSPGFSLLSWLWTFMSGVGQAILQIWVAMTILVAFFGAFSAYLWVRQVGVSWYPFSLLTLLSRWIRRCCRKRRRNRLGLPDPALMAPFPTCAHFANRFERWGCTEPCPEWQDVCRGFLDVPAGTTFAPSTLLVDPEDLPPRPCKRKFGVRQVHMGFMKYAPPWKPASCQHEEWNAITHKLLPETPKAALMVRQRVRLPEIRALYKDSPYNKEEERLTTPQWVERGDWNPKRKARMLAAEEWGLRRGAARRSRFRKFSMMVKQEKTAPSKIKKAPRCIQIMSDEFQTLTGPTYERFNRVLKRAWHRKNWLTYACGYTPSELGEWFDEAYADVARHGTVYYISIDCKACDLHNNEELMCLQHSVTEQMCTDQCELDAVDAMSDLVVEGCSKCGVRYRRVGSRPTGRNDTSFGNTLVCGSCHAKARDMVPRGWRSIVGGDDSFTMVAGPFLPKLLDSLKRCYESAGFEIELTVTPFLHEATFFSGLFYPGPPTRFGPLIGRTLFKMGFQDRVPPICDREWRRASALSLLAFASHVPVLGAIARKTLAQTEGVKDRVLPWSYNMSFRDPETFDVTPANLAFVADRYKIHESAITQDDLSWLRDGICDIPDYPYLTMLNKDLPIKNVDSSLLCARPLSLLEGAWFAILLSPFIEEIAKHMFPLMIFIIAVLEGCCVGASGWDKVFHTVFRTAIHGFFWSLGLPFGILAHMGVNVLIFVGAALQEFWSTSPPADLRHKTESLDVNESTEESRRRQKDESEEERRAQVERWNAHGNHGRRGRCTQCANLGLCHAASPRECTTDLERRRRGLSHCGEVHIRYRRDNVRGFCGCKCVVWWLCYVCWTKRYGEDGVCCGEWSLHLGHEPRSPDPCDLRICLCPPQGNGDVSHHPGLLGLADTKRQGVLWPRPVQRAACEHRCIHRHERCRVHRYDGHCRDQWEFGDSMAPPYLSIFCRGLWRNDEPDGSLLEGHQLRLGRDLRPSLGCGPDLRGGGGGWGVRHLRPSGHAALQFHPILHDSQLVRSGMSCGHGFGSADSGSHNELRGVAERARSIHTLHDLPVHRHGAGGGRPASGDHRQSTGLGVIKRESRAWTQRRLESGQTDFWSWQSHLREFVWSQDPSPGCLSRAERLARGSPPRRASPTLVVANQTRKQAGIKRSLRTLPCDDSAGTYSLPPAVVQNGCGEQIARRPSTLSRALARGAPKPDHTTGRPQKRTKLR